MGVKVREWKKGQWWILIDHKGKRKSVKVGSKEAAKTAARKIEEALTTGKLNLNPPESPKSVLFKEYAEKWFAGHVSVNLKPSTQHGVHLILDKALLPEFGDKPLDKITRNDVKTFAYRMLEAGRAKEIKLADGGKTKTLSRSSVMGMGRTLSAIFNHAIEDGILASNPAQRPGRYIRTGDRREKIDFLTPEEGRALLEGAKAHHPRHYPILAAALCTGARQGELLALQWGDIDWRGKFIEIPPGELERDHFHPGERQGAARGPRGSFGGNTNGTPACSHSGGVEGGTPDARMGIPLRRRDCARCGQHPEGIRQGIEESGAPANPLSRPAAYVRVLAHRERGISCLREGSDGAPFHPDHRGHLRAPDPRGEPRGGQSAGRDGRKSATYTQPGTKKGSGEIA
jgi:hypothetical protein